jgi:hypothetical protein
MSATLRGRIYNMLRTIADETYPNRISWFSVDVLGEEFASRLGDYDNRTKKIRIMNLSNSAGVILATTIHELAHHCEFCFGVSSSSKLLGWENLRVRA